MWICYTQSEATFHEYTCMQCSELVSHSVLLWGRRLISQPPVTFTTQSSSLEKLALQTTTSKNVNGKLSGRKTCLRKGSQEGEAECWKDCEANVIKKNLFCSLSWPPWLVLTWFTWIWPSVWNYASDHPEKYSLKIHNCSTCRLFPDLTTFVWKQEVVSLMR